MGVTTPRSRVDERVTGAGTTVRFALLVVLLLAAGGAMMLPVVKSLSDTDATGCLLAMGTDPDRTDMVSVINALSQNVPYRACMARYAPPPATWLVFGWPVLLAALAALLFVLLPAWKAWRRGVVPLEAADPDGEIRSLLTELAVTAGLTRLPRVVVDRTAVDASAVVFGRNRRPTVCLFGGLLACRGGEPGRFRAVVLHEFAHIANRDVTVAYGTVAVWRAFLALIIVPYLLWAGRYLHGFLTSWGEPTDVPLLIRRLLLPALMVALIYLARSDVLRSREIYADLAAVRWGADPREWNAGPPRPADGGRPRRAFGSLRELWGTHPRWEERHGALADPAPLFGARALPVFLTGAAVMMVNVYLLTYLSTYDLYSLWRVQLVSLVPAVLVAGVVGIALWRAVAYAVLTGGPIPSGARTGLWLGAGAGVGQLLIGYGVSRAEWMPRRPALLLLVVCAGIAFAWWVTQCARLWVGAWRGRSLRLPLLLGLGAAVLVLAAWFAWWTMDGATWAAGAAYSDSGMRQAVLDAFPGSGGPAGTGATAEDHAAVSSAVATIWPMLGGFVATPLVPAALAALWVVPLAGWVPARAPGVPPWAAGALPDGSDRLVLAGEPPPSPLRALGPGVLGGASCWAAVVGVQALLPAPPFDAGQGTALHETFYLVGLFIALLAPAGAAAVVAAARCGRGHRLVGALIAAESAAVLGAVGMALLVSSDGCLGPLNTLESSCSWRPVWDTMLWTLPRLVNGVLTIAAIIALLVAAAGSLVGHARRGRPDVRGTPSPLRGKRAGTGRRTVRGDRRKARPVASAGAAAACAAVVLAVAEPLAMANFHTLVPDSVTTQQTARRWLQVTDVRVSDDIRARQVHAWHRLGGRYLLEHARADDTYLRATLLRAVEAEDVRPASLTRLRPVCADYGRIADWVNTHYFRAPDGTAQSAWQALGTRAEKGSTDCERAFEEQDRPLFVSAMKELLAAGRNAGIAKKRVETILREGGYRTYLNSTRPARAPGW
ncbi:M48 family metalloprotease [Streptomyces sp. NPDC004266]|uniref:M48 family metalloprotease n=1 Tax=Streptomyces sp. NPDC004266 TaxID=3364693 RepID=UPI0036BDC348